MREKNDVVAHRSLKFAIKPSKGTRTQYLRASQLSDKAAKAGCSVVVIVSI